MLVVAVPLELELVLILSSSRSVGHDSNIGAEALVMDLLGGTFTSSAYARAMLSLQSSSSVCSIPSVTPPDLSTHMCLGLLNDGVACSSLLRGLVLGGMLGWSFAVVGGLALAKF